MLLDVVTYLWKDLVWIIQQLYCAHCIFKAYEVTWCRWRARIVANVSSQGTKTLRGLHLLLILWVSDKFTQP